MNIRTSNVSPLPAAIAERHALVRLDGLHLMLLQGGIRTLEPLADIRRDDPPENGIGWIDFQRAKWPVYCLTEDLAAAITLPPSRRICALLAVENGFVGLACNDVVLIKEGASRSHLVPDCMAPVRSPVTALVRYGGGMACVTSPQRIADYLGWQGHEVALTDVRSNRLRNDHG